MNCQSECDCGAPTGPHEPDCHSHQICDEGKWCDKHLGEEEAELCRLLRNVPRFQVYGDAQAIEEFNQQLRDAGRGHLIRE